MFSCLAGFIECGESAEEAIVREVKEEVGIDVANIRYVGSQAWPFPHQLMLGYVAAYKAGEIIKEDKELRAADWFAIDKLPVIPPPQTIARQLIEQAITLISADSQP
jgi:NAD+ diphosphatase